ncbi:hypothetical protein pEaSNUABM50_00432 [Erwinia phage pEa_SNUABM_50]|uniref:Uncharacterized protein n=4 Tax=Eneladusvirus BF TaxID=2560751 RepID=A0A7L8ZPE4_9CAUD|nr:hypothetical protein FDH34_gp492 [Serratia phage BF]QOI71367.1 hypothetical protein pEaSNUABM12_00438 [Erwinia phage pEa_SNUABM_12]QOI71909.1 hypothetical protein pEaSNUABM47_00434 [Erwinia phage pEa_SNUABM_47]QOI72448.1 hypothetical protein pEaSNUABM50_00432 [Erwinia phage pEa_SNUABM_50]QXO11575.1 hypothetical protein pEaSNUABM19_00438 [Erwinia phage pEa_SNUABM_19]QXO12123.1 hypothetical protein pEaSNUABM44_00436 [Erwinia phage pEa_SNUABM_44]QXO12676.1 hypothetical protein pEaSNUABM49_004
MSIKIDPETQTAVDPESIGKGMWKRAVLAICVIAAIIVTAKIL